MKLPTIITLLMISPFLLTATANANWLTGTFHNGEGYHASTKSGEYHNSIFQVGYMPDIQCQPLGVWKIMLKDREPNIDGFEETEVSVRVDDRAQHKRPAGTADELSTGADNVVLEQTFMPVDATLHDDLREGTTLRITDGDRYDWFSLVGSRAAMARAESRCQAKLDYNAEQAKHFE